MENRKSIKWKLVGAIGTTVLISFSVMAAFTYIFTRNLVVDQIDSITLNDISAAKEQIEVLFETKVQERAEAAGEIYEVYLSALQSGEITQEEFRSNLERIFLSEEFGGAEDSAYVFTMSYEGILDIHPTDSGLNLKGYEPKLFETLMQTNLSIATGTFDGIDKYYGLYFIPEAEVLICSAASLPEMKNMIGTEDLQLFANDHAANGKSVFFFTKEGEMLAYPFGYFIGLDINDFDFYSDGERILSSDFPESGSAEYDFDLSKIKSIDTEGLDIVDQGPKETYFEWIEGLDLFVGLTAEDAERMALVTRLRRIIIILVLISVSIADILTWFFSHRIVNTMKEVVKLTDFVTGSEKTNLSEMIHIDSKDEVGTIAQGVNSLISKLNTDMSEVRGSYEKLSSAASEMSTLLTTDVKHHLETINLNAGQVARSVDESNASTEQANATIEEIVRSIDNVNQNIERQVAAVEESAAAMEEMSRNIENVTVTANQTQGISNELNQVALEGGHSVREAVKSVKEVSEFSNQIVDMLKVITDIANQTNLLAMNASIEAAHAGEAGKGFAIVADEIRRLSENTNKNANEIGDVVSNIVERIESSVKLSEEASNGLERIMSSSNETSEKIAGLNTTMEEQNYTAKEILRSIQEIVTITEEVKLAMNEQSNGIAEFGEMIAGLREYAQSNKESLTNHMDSLNQLLSSVEKMNTLTKETDKQSRSLADVLSRFILDESKGDESAKTGLKLID